MLGARARPLTLHDGYVHRSPACARHAAEAGPVGDGRTAPAGHQSSPAHTRKHTHRCTLTSLSRGVCRLA